MYVINRTPHHVEIRTPDGNISVRPSGIVARVATTEESLPWVGSIPIVRRTFGKVEGIDGIPEEAICIVSSLVLEAAKAQGCADRLYAPDTGPTAIRDESGQIVAVTRLVGA